MKKKSDTLFRLIQSLKEEEQSAFEQSVQLSSGATNTLSLLYFIYKNSADFESAENQLIKIPYSNISVLKSNLKQILKQFLIEKLPESGLLLLVNKFQELELYYNRNLFDEVESVVEEIKMLSNRLGLYWPFFPVNHFKFKLSNNYIDKNVDEYKRNIIEENKKQCIALQNQLDVSGFAEEIIGFTQKNLDIKSKKWQSTLSGFERNPLFSYGSKKIDSSQNMSLQVAKATIAQAQGNVNQAFYLIKELWLFLKKDLDFNLNYKRFEVVTNAYNLLSVAASTKKQSNIKYALNEIGTLLEEKKIGEAHVRLYYQAVSLEFVFHFKSTKLGGVLKEHELFLKETCSHVTSPLKRIYTLLIATSFFKLEDYIKCSEYCMRELESFSHNDNRVDMKIDFQLLYVMSLFSLLIKNRKNFIEQKTHFKDLFKSHYDSLRRNKNFKERIVELKIIELLIKVTPKISMEKLVNEMEKTLEQISQLPQSLQTDNYADLLNTIDWLRQSIEKCRSLS